MRVSPCLIIVCSNNTATPKPIYDYVSGSDYTQDDGHQQTRIRPHRRLGANNVTHYEMKYPAGETIHTVEAIRHALQHYKHRIRERHKFYSQDLINNLFTHPYTKIDFVRNDLQVTRVTATRYLDALVADGFLHKQKIGRTNYYINIALNDILTGEAMTEGIPDIRTA